MALLPSGTLMVGSGTSPEIFGYDLIKGEARRWNQERFRKENCQG